MLEALSAAWSWFLSDVAPYSPPAVYLLGFSWAGQISKRFLLTESNVRRAARLRDELRARPGAAPRALGLLLALSVAVPLPVHPIAAAAVLAALPLPMVPGVPDDYWHRLVLLEGAALGSLGFYDLAHALLRRRGLDVRLPGEPSLPPPAPERSGEVDSEP